MKKERWRLYAKKADFADIRKAYGINQVTARIMRNRGVETKEEIESYLKGDLDYLSDPALMKDADKAASLLEAAIANNELIAISSDFDNDGIFSGLLLKEAIIELGGRAAIFSPNRVMEGYGVNSLPALDQQWHQPSAKDISFFHHAPRMGPHDDLSQ